MIGGIAVLLTLIYLAIQTRETRRAAEETASFASNQALFSTINAFFNWRTLIIYNPAASEVMAKSKRGEPLEEAEQIVFSNIMEHLFFCAVAAYSSSKAEISNHEEWSDVDYVLYILAEYPNGVEDWQRMEQMVGSASADFVELVNRGLTSHEV